MIEFTLEDLILCMHAGRVMMPYVECNRD
ncbi:hypothetical protein Goari_026444 [Gossypium aridum]|uniref:Uncharacterized protein n=1 Tax=Gossypium aridum TaxID=34290 RepID=A0A7J8XDA5_GOSAI|nr:hypothetical protein [Gossypium aridum]